MITVFWARFAYVNPGVPYLVHALAALKADGVRVVDVTHATADEVAAAAARSVGAVIDQSVYNAAFWATPGFGQYYVYDLKPRAHYQEALERLLDAPTAKLFAAYVDLHDPKNFALLEHVAGRVGALSWMFERRPVTRDEVPPQYLDGWFTEAHDPLGAWQRARALFPVRVELPFALGASEVRGRPGRVRWQSCVAGTPYATRRIARRSMRAAGVRMAPFAQGHLATRALNRVLPRVLPARPASELSIRASHRLQHTLVNGSAVNFVCGSALAFPVRKFFEVAGAGRAMVAYPCVGFEAYGFRDGVHAVTAAPEDVGVETRRLLADDARRERLASAALGLVRTRHTAERRAADLVECVRRLAAGALRGAEFVDGHFEFR